MATDILVDSDGNLILTGAGLTVGPSTGQHVRDIITARKGWWKHAPAYGAALGDTVNSAGSLTGVSGLIRQELARDGLTINQVTVTGAAVTVDAGY